MGKGNGKKTDVAVTPPVESLPEQPPETNGTSRSEPVNGNGNANGNGHQPIRRVRYPVVGGTLSVSVWPKTINTDSGTREVFNALLQRSYHDGQQWVWTHYLREGDLPVAALAIQEAYRLVAQLRQGEEVPF
jgi:hypothetical protein